MQYATIYPSPLGDILLTADDAGLTGLWFEERRHPDMAAIADTRDDLPLFFDVRRWLDAYFSGNEPRVMPTKLHLIGTEFQQSVWAKLVQIPYGQVVTYGDIAQELAVERGIARMSAQAVGGAVGRNPVSVIVPCHRVIGAGGKLTGYSSGIERKIALLSLEGIDLKAR